MRLPRWMLFLLFMLSACAPMVAVATPTCQDGQCTFSPNYAQAKADLTAGHPVLATVRRSVGVVGKAVAAPVRVVVKIVKAKPARKLLRAVAKIRPARRAVALGGRLICPRRRCCK